MTMRTSIRRRVYLTMGGIFVLCVIVVGFFSYGQQVSRIKESYADLPKAEGRLFLSMIAADGDGLERAHLGLGRMDEMIRLFVEKKREALLSHTTPFFGEMKNTKITHMYFIEADGTVFLRVHKPEQAGDKLTRFTYATASSTGKVTTGLEMGKNFFSLRSVAPISVDGKPAGYLEVAQEIDHIFQEMKSTTGNEVALFLTEEYVAKKGAALKNEKVGTFTLLNATDKEKILPAAAQAASLLSNGAGGGGVELIDVGGRKYIAAASPVTDAAGDKAGVLFSMRDVSDLYAAIWRGVLTKTLAVSAILLAAFGLLFLSLRKSLGQFDDVRQHIVGVTTTWDLTRRLQIDSADEIGELAHEINIMTEKLSEMVLQVSISSSELRQVSTDVHGVSKQVLTSAEVQVSNLSETSAGLTEINASIREVGESVEGLAVSAAETSSSIMEITASMGENAENMDQLAMSVDEVSSSIAEITSSIRQVGDNVASLLDASNATASSVAQMDSTIKQVEQNAISTAAIAADVLKDAEQGKEAVEATIEGIHVIRKSAQVTADVMGSLSDKVGNIGTILSVIDDITEQTNLLALNASIIAAQAGEHGKGFAVVANEIKELAERTRISTREIGDVIKGVQSETRRAVEAIGQAEDSIRDGEDLSIKSGEALVKIVGGVKRSSAQVDEIARAMYEQAAGSQLVKKAMEHVSDMVAQIVAANREQGRASDLIMRASERMRGLAGEVRTSIREQNEAGRQISRSTEYIDSMIRQIRSSSNEQRLGAEMVTRSIEAIRTSTDGSMDSVRVLERSVEKLAGRMQLLHEEIAKFNVGAGTAA